MRVLITGKQGFTGHYVSKELEAHGHIVVGLQSDLMDSVAVNKEIHNIQPEAVIHLAAIAYVCHKDIHEVYNVNLIGTLNLLKALENESPNVRNILLISSANVYATSDQIALTEDSALSPINDYAVSKLSMEFMARLWMDRLPISILRPFNYTGVGQSKNFLVPKIVDHFQKKAKTIELGNLNVYREIGDVRLVAKWYRQLLEQCLIGKTINICTNQVYLLQDIFDICADISKFSMKIKTNPAFVRTNEISILKGDNSYLKTFISPLKTPYLEDTISWMLSTYSNAL